MFAEGIGFGLWTW